MTTPSRIPRFGERTAEFQQGYGRCQCGCGGLVTVRDERGLYARYLPDHDAPAVSRRAGGERPVGAARDRRASVPFAPSDLDSQFSSLDVLVGRYTTRRAQEPGRRESDRLVEMFADQAHARQQLEVKLGILQSEIEFAIKYVRAFCAENSHAAGEALVARLEAALASVRQDPH